MAQATKAAAAADPRIKHTNVRMHISHCPFAEPGRGSASDLVAVLGQKQKREEQSETSSDSEQRSKKHHGLEKHDEFSPLKSLDDLSRF